MTQPNQTFKKRLLTEEDTLAFAKQVSDIVKEGIILFLNGPLGAGKTTFARGFLRGLGYQGKVKSPTYTLVEPYEIGAYQIFHFDFYRLNNPDELIHMGIHDYFFPEAICLIEWPEKGSSVLPEADLSCYLSFEGEGRNVELVPHSEKGSAILRRLIEASKDEL